MTTGVLPFDEFKVKASLTTGFFETSQTTENAQMATCSGNHDDAGLSIGNLQYNYGAADRAQEFFKYMVDNHRAIVDAAFGANTTQRDTFINVTNTYTRENRVSWADSISALDSNGEKRLLIEPYKSAFGAILTSAEGKAKYYAMKDNYYWNPIYELFRHMGCKSRAACASFFDIYVNKGRCYPVNLIQADFDRIDADTTITEYEKEAQKIYAINWRGNYDNAVNPYVNAWGNIDQITFWHGDGVDDGRRGCMANQEGVYYGAVYDPEGYFDINQEPATEEKAGEKPLNVNLGAIQIQDAYLGTTPIKEIYLGATLIGGGTAAAVTSSRVPVTQFRTNPASWQGIGAVSSINLEAGKPIWIDVQEPFVGCRTYYTTDGSTPTTASPKYTDALTFNQTTTLKVLTVSNFGVAAAVKTLTVNVAAAPVTTISPSATVQNTIPITITLSTSEAGAAIKYRIGTDATVRDYTAPFTVSQNTAGVLGTQISIYYWAVGASATEAEKSITYDTSGALPAKSVLTATAGTGKVDLSWTASQNATAFTIYRSTVAGQLGTWIGASQYLSPSILSYSDTGVTAGQTYYYTIRAGNYGSPTDSDQKAATPTAAVAGYRYIRIDGYGEYYSAAGYTTTRMIEVEIFSGGVNVLRSPTVLTASTDDTVDTGAEVGSLAPTKINNNDKSIAASSYNIWWGDITLNGNAGNAWVKFDLGSAKTIDSIRYWAYPSRAPRFKIWGTNNLADFGANGAHGAATLLWDMSANNGTANTGATAGTNNYIEM